MVRITVVVAIKSNRNQVIIPVISDEINNRYEVLSRILPQTTAELLGKDNAGLRAAQHYDLI